MKSLQPASLKVTGILFLLIIFVSCEKNEEDKLLKDQLIGTWKSTNSYYKSYTFNKDNTFIDTAFYLQSEIPLDFKIIDVITGDYMIDNGHLTFSNIHLAYFEGQDSEYAGGYSTTYDPLYNISFEGDVLVLTQKDVFESVNITNSGIIGKWRHDKLFAVYDKNSDNKFTGGILRGVYDFKPDLSVNWQYETSYDNIVNTDNWTATYDLNNSSLSINQWGLYNLTVSYPTKMMIWIYHDRTFERKQ